MNLAIAFFHNQVKSMRTKNEVAEIWENSVVLRADKAIYNAFADWYQKLWKVDFAIYQFIANMT